MDAMAGALAGSGLSGVFNTLGNLINLGLGNSSQSMSKSLSKSVEDAMSASRSWGASAQAAFNEMNSWQQAVNDSMGESWSDSQAENWSQGRAEGWSESHAQSAETTYGREASAQDILNAALANEVQRDLWSMQAEYNAKEALRNREFQREMSNTAYQRAIKDLKAAGLNPILAVGNMGASTPVGSMATSGLAQASKANAYAQSEGYSSSASKSYNYSRNDAYGYSKSSSYGYNKSHGESSGGSYGYGWSEGSSSEGSWSNSSSHGESASKSLTKSKSSNNAKDVVNGIKDVVKGTTKLLTSGGSAERYYTV